MRITSILNENRLIAGLRASSSVFHKILKKQVLARIFSKAMKKKWVTSALIEPRIDT